MLIRNDKICSIKYFIALDHFYFCGFTWICLLSLSHSNHHSKQAHLSLQKRSCFGSCYVCVSFNSFLVILSFPIVYLIQVFSLYFSLVYSFTHVHRSPISHISFSFSYHFCFTFMHDLAFYSHLLILFSSFPR